MGSKEQIIVIALVATLYLAQHTFSNKLTCKEGTYEKFICSPTWMSWKGMEFLNCKTMASKEYCKNGTYGPGWKSIWGNFSEYADRKGRTALVCPECGCRGESPPIYIAHCGICATNPCNENAWKCEDYGTRYSKYRCFCKDPYFGDNCEKESRLCDGKCSNRSVCRLTGCGRKSCNKDTYWCRCKENFTGRNCKKDKKFCDDGKCNNRGVCTIRRHCNKDVYQCRCQDNFFGKNCEYDYREYGTRFWYNDNDFIFKSFRVGRIEIYLNGEWKKVCASNVMQMSVAEKACQVYNGTVSHLDVDLKGIYVNMNMSVVNMNCEGKEKLSECQMEPGSSCQDKYYYVDVYCDIPEEVANSFKAPPRDKFCEGMPPWMLG